MSLTAMRPAVWASCRTSRGCWFVLLLLLLLSVLMSMAKSWSSAFEEISEAARRVASWAISAGLTPRSLGRSAVFVRALWSVGWVSSSVGSVVVCCAAA